MIRYQMNSRFTKSAARRVAPISELLETILVQLPILDLLLVQRVSKCFKLCIDASMPLQRKLHFFPQHWRDKYNEPQLNPIFDERLFEKTALVIPTARGALFLSSPPSLDVLRRGDQIVWSCAEIPTTTLGRSIDYDTISSATKCFWEGS